MGAEGPPAREASVPAPQGPRRRAAKRLELLVSNNIKIMNIIYEMIGRLCLVVFSVLISDHSSLYSCTAVLEAVLMNTNLFPPLCNKVLPTLRRTPV